MTTSYHNPLPKQLNNNKIYSPIFSHAPTLALRPPTP